jgi:hypothetical protein
MPLHLRPPLPKVTAPIVPGCSKLFVRSPPSVDIGGSEPPLRELPLDPSP